MSARTPVATNATKDSTKTRYPAKPVTVSPSATSPTIRLSASGNPVPRTPRSARRASAASA